MNTKSYSYIFIGGLVLMLGLVVVFGAVPAGAAVAPHSVTASSASSYVEEATGGETGNEEIPPPGEYKFDCGCGCTTGAANDSSIQPWILGLLGMLLVAILVVLIFKKPQPQQRARFKQGKSDEYLQNTMMTSQPGGQPQAMYAPQPRPAAPQPREESFTDQMLKNARATVAGGQTAGQRATGSSSTAQSSPRSGVSASSTQQSPAPRGSIQSAPTKPTTPSANQQ